jgi:hypothetical protein
VVAAEAERVVPEARVGRIDRINFGSASFGVVGPKRATASAVSILG